MDKTVLITGGAAKDDYKMRPEREADHIWRIYNINKARNHYSELDIRIGIC